MKDNSSRGSAFIATPAEEGRRSEGQPYDLSFTTVSGAGSSDRPSREGPQRDEGAGRTQSGFSLRDL